MIRLNQDDSCDNVIHALGIQNDMCVDTGSDTSEKYQWPYFYRYDQSSTCEDPADDRLITTRDVSVRGCRRTDTVDDDYYIGFLGDDAYTASESYTTYVYVVNDDQWKALNGGLTGAVIVGSFFAVLTVVGIVYCVINSRLQMNKQTASMEMNKI
jgi:hypothetical protein